MAFKISRYAKRLRGSAKSLYTRLQDLRFPPKPSFALALLGLFWIASPCLAQLFPLAASPEERALLESCISVPTVAQMERDLVASYLQEVPRLPRFDLDGFILENVSKGAIEDIHSITSNTVGGLMPIGADGWTARSWRRAAPPDAGLYGRNYQLREYQRKNPKCREPVCAAKAIFGEAAGVKILWAYKYTGLNLSRFQMPMAVDFSAENLDAAIRAMLLLPTALREKITLSGQGFFRVPLRVGSTIAYAHGAILDPIDTNWQSARTYIFFHEFGHRAGGILIQEGALQRRLDETTEWLSFSGWTGFFGAPANPITLISEYAGDTAGEDFAESFAAYRFAPNRLQQRAYLKYEFLKRNVFNGVEYRGKSVCESQ